MLTYSQILKHQLVERSVPSYNTPYSASVTNQFKTKSHSVDELRDIIVALIDVEVRNVIALFLQISPKTISRSVDELRDC